MDTGTLGWMALAAGNGLLAVGGGLLYWRERRRSRALGASLEAANTELDTQVTHDTLTGLRGRAEFDHALDEAVYRCDRGGPPFSILYVDLDNLTAINDAFGHEAGDAVLREAAGRLTGPGQIASRIVADEFAVLVSGDRAEALAAAQALRERLAAPFVVGERTARLSCSVGIAGYPHHGSRPKLLGKAVLAMRSVKALGGASHAEYTVQLGEAQRQQAELLDDLKQAVDRQQFELYYQPKVDALTLQVTAAEALIRWKHPQRGLVSPAVFIPLAERHGLMWRIGEWVIVEACRQAGEWRRQGLRMRVAINVSGAQLRQDDLAARLQAALTANHVPPARFTCEITESVAMEDTEATRHAFERLRSAGVHVSIDDFGTGHSSLAALRRLPAGELKIDRAFVCDLETSNGARSIARAIVQMAHTLELRVVAEGVETEGQRDVLMEIGCDELQGYLFAKPMTAQALTLWASDERPAEGRAGGFRASIYADTAPTPL